jgi:hypothetical protein
MEAIPPGCVTEPTRDGNDVVFASGDRMRATVLLVDLLFQSFCEAPREVLILIGWQVSSSRLRSLVVPTVGVLSRMKAY